MRINMECFFGPSLPKNEFWDRNFKKLIPDSESALPRYHVCQAKETILTFSSPSLPRNAFWNQNFKSGFQVRIWNRHLQDTICATLQAKLKTFDIFSPNSPKNGFWGRYFKNLSVDQESTCHVYQFSVKTDNFEFFGLNLGKLPRYMQYFGSNNDEGVAES